MPHEARIMLLLACVCAAAAAAALRPPSAGAFTAGSCPNSGAPRAAVAWGGNSTGELGLGYRTSSEGTPSTVLGLDEVKEVQPGFQSTVALLENCTLVSWGKPFQGGLGDGKPGIQAKPVPVGYWTGPIGQKEWHALEDVKQVSIENGDEPHGMALQYNGTVWTWGAGEFGERGNGEKDWPTVAHLDEPEISKPRDQPAQIGLSEIEQIGAGSKQDYALGGPGKEVWAWGEDAGGQLGVDDPEAEKECHGLPSPKKSVPCVLTPLVVKTSGLEELTGVEKIAVGEGTTYALRDGGKELLGWGSNKGGQLMDLPEEQVTLATKLPWTPSSRIVEISAGDGTAFARLANGTVYAWGGDEDGQLGFSPEAMPEVCPDKEKCTRKPIEIPALEDVVQIAPGDQHTYVIKEELAEEKRVIYAFGKAGELLGLGSKGEALKGPLSTPTPIEGLPSVATVAAGRTIGAAVLEGSGPAPAVSTHLVPGEAGIAIEWGALAEAYDLIWSPAGGKQSGSRETTCDPGQPGGIRCGGEDEVLHLAPETYLFQLYAGPEEQNGNWKSKLASKRYSVSRKPEAPVGAPLELTAPEIEAAVEGEGQAEEYLAQVGHAVKVKEGTWSSESPVTQTRQWLRCEGYGVAGAEGALGEECKPIEGATGTTYEPTEADIGHTLVVEEKAANEKSDAGYPTVAKSEPVIVRGTEPDEGNNSEPAGEDPPVLPAAPTDEVAPEIGGPTTVLEGETLTLKPGVWSDELVPSLSNDKWYRCRDAITDETEEGEEEELGSSCELIREPAVEGQEALAHEGLTYATRPADIGYYIEAAERAGNSGGYGSLRTSPVEVEASTPPVLESPRPSIAFPEPEGLKMRFNDVQVEQVLTARPGKWSNSPTSYDYLWERCSAGACKEITEGTSKHKKPATKEHYTVSAADRESTIRLSVTAKNGAGASEPAYAETVTVPPTPGEPSKQAPPTITGADGHSLSAHQGTRVSATQGVWTLPAAGYAYLEKIEDQWRRCTVEAGEETCSTVAKTGTTSRCAIVGGQSVECACESEGPALCACGSSDERECATKGETPGTTYGLTSEDVGSKLRVRETMEIPGTSSTAEPTSSEWVEALGEVPVSTSVPKIEGVAKQGDTLTEIHGKWKNEPTGYSYQWLRCSSGCETIPGATQQTYTVTAEDIGLALAVEEIASNATGPSQAARSEPTPTVLPHQPVLESAPTVSGVDQQGHPLTASTGAWAYSPTSYHYQWLRCAPESSECANIGGANGPEYELQHADVGSSVRVRVIAENAGGGGRAESESTAPVTVGSPLIERVTPDSGPPGGGTIVVISGQNLGEASAVEFGFWPATSFESTPTSITAVVPPGTTGTVSVTVTTRHGGASASSEADLFSYVPAPNITAVQPAKGSPAGGGTVTISGEGLGEATTVSFGQEPATSFTVLSPSSIEAVAPAGAAGTVELSVTTPSGTSARSAHDGYTYVGPPTVTRVEPDEGATAGGQVVTISGEWLEEASTVSFGGQPGTIKADSATTITAEAPPGGAGTTNVTVTTPYGTSATGGHDSFTYVAPPVVSKVEPAKGAVAGGTTTTIAGEGFGGVGEVTNVSFAGKSAEIESYSATSLVVKAPAGTGTADITVTTRYGGTSATGEHDRFTYVGLPVISGLTPNTGNEEGGTTVIVTGENLAEASEVTFGTTKARSFNVLSASAIEAVAPLRGKPGTVEISVTTPYGQSEAAAADKFTYGPPPHVGGISPSSGAASGGTLVEITGKELKGATVVEFGGTPAEIVSPPEGGELVVRAPSGVVGEVHVTVTTPYGTSATSGKDLFTYRPRIASVTPDSGPAAGGTEVKVTGAGFVAGSERAVFEFGSTRATAVSCASSTECTITSPKHNANTVEISATVDGISNPNTAAADFTFNG
ncbi:MAG TPA: IPT/TIG domain-containing protein [Solirubrobacteraceae bacterium]|nr:IPT/TIG domain-containing protein [Solirubrobacteraceae bacterium]